MFASLAIALVAIGLAIGCLLRPSPGARQPAATPAPNYTEQQTADAKASVCAAFGKVVHGIELADAESASSSDRAAQVAAAALTRVALDFGSRYLFLKLSEEPATPLDVATAIRRQANAFQELLIDYINGSMASDPRLETEIKASEEETANIRQMCK